MLAIIKASTCSAVAIGALLCLADIADAGGLIALTDGQLDRVTASGVTVASSSAATSQALWSSAQTNTNTIVLLQPRERLAPYASFAAGQPKPARALWGQVVIADDEALGVDFLLI